MFTTTIKFLANTDSTTMSATSLRTLSTAVNELTNDEAQALFAQALRHSQFGITNVANRGAATVQQLHSLATVTH